MTGAPEPRARRPARPAWLAVAVVGFVLIASIAWLEIKGVGRPRADRPSIVLVLIDTLRADYLGTYGFEGDVSPRIDRFASEAIVFENAFSQAPWTKPSIATLFTSLHPRQHGVTAHGALFRRESSEKHAHRASALPRRARTLAEALRRAGYDTAAFVANPWIQESLGFAQGFATFDAEAAGNDVGAAELLAKADAWLDERDDDRPFFLYLHLMDIHGPYDPPDEDLEAVQGSASLGEPRQLSLDERQRRRRYLMKSPWTRRPEGARLEAWRGRYAAGVRALDREVGGFLDGLAGRGLLDDAIVVLTSDHGEELVDHGGFDHGHTLYDEQIHVPLVVRLPEGAHGGRRVAEVVGLIDVMPTLLGLAGAEAPATLAGRDLGALLDGGRLAGADVALSAGVKWRPEVESARTRTHKLVRDGETGKTELYDLAADPAESRDVAAAEPEIAAALERELAENAARIARSPVLRARRARMAAGTADKLRALGYLEPAGPEKDEEPQPSPGGAAHATTDSP